MATKSSTSSNSEFSLQEQLFKAIQNKYPDAEAKKINKDNFLDIYIPTISPGRGTHLFFNTVKGAIKIGYYTRDESFINKVVSNASNSIQGASNGLRIIGNPKFDDLKDALSAAFDFLASITNDSQSNSIIEGVKSIETESIEDIGTKFRDSFSSEDELAESISSYLDDFSEKGKIVVLQIEEEDLIKLIENHDLLSGDLFSMIGIVDLKSWKPLSKLIGKTESEWVKNEFEEENPSSIVLLYSGDNYVYAFSSPNDEFDGLSADGDYDPDDTSNSDDLNGFIGIIKSKTKKSQFEIIGYKNTLEEWEEFYTVNVNETIVTLKLTRRYYDSYWKASISKDELIDALEEFQEDQDLDMVFQFNWNFYKDGEGYNEVEIELLDYDYDALPAECWEDNDKELGELDAYKIFSDYPSTLDDDDTLTKGNFGSISINFESEEIFKINSRAFELLNEYNFSEGDDSEDSSALDYSTNHENLNDSEQINIEEFINLNSRTLPQILSLLKKLKNKSYIKIRAYTNEYSELTFWLKFKINDSTLEVTRTNWSSDSYWILEVEKELLLEGLNAYLDNNDIDELIINHFDPDSEEYRFDGVGDLDNGFNYEVTDVNPDLEEVPEIFQDENGDLDIFEVSNELLPFEEELSETSKGKISIFDIYVGDQTFRIDLTSKEYFKEDEGDDQEEVDNDAIMAARWKDETPARITLLFDSLLAILSHFHTRGSNDDDIQYFMVEFENITSSEIILSNNKILNKVRKKVMKEWDEKDEEEWIERYCSAYEILVRDFNLESVINQSLINLSRMQEEDSGEYDLTVLANLGLPLTIFSDTNEINDEGTEPKNTNQIGMYSYNLLECSVQVLRKDINRRNITNETKIEIIVYNNTLTEFDEDYTSEIEGQEVWLTISRSYNDSYWKTELDKQELSNLFNCIQDHGFKYALDEVLFELEFYAPGDFDNSFEIKLKECNEELLPENCFDGGEVNPYFIFDEYECNFEDVDITLRGETERLDIIIDEEYLGSIWSDMYPSK